MGEESAPATGPVRRWGGATKRAITWVILVLLALVVYRFRQVLPPLIIAFILAFILEPVVGFLVRRLRMGRTLATALVFLLVILVGLGALAAPVTALPAITRAVRSVQVDFGRIIRDIGAFVERPVQIGEYSLDLSPVYEQVSQMLSRFVASIAQGTLDLVFSLASGALQVVFILLAAFYMVKDAPRIVHMIDRLAPPGYRDDLVRLRYRITDVWNAFLRGQVLLGVAVGAIVAVVCTAIGLPYGILMGVIAGLLEVVPNIGPTLAAVPAILIALFQGSSFLPLGNFWMAVLVAGLYIIIQQVENNFLVPRILGRSLDLHPLIVIVAIIVGASLAGILGMLLATPVVATLRVVSRYVFYRLYDRDPFAELERSAPPGPGLLSQVGRAVVAWLRRLAKRKSVE